MPVSDLLSLTAVKIIMNSSFDFQFKKDLKSSSLRGCKGAGSEVEIMEVITDWEVFSAVNLAFCQFQGMLGIITVSGIVIFKHNLRDLLSILR